MRNCIVCAVAFLMLLSGCHWFNKKESRPTPDVSAVDVKLVSKRFDVDLFTLRTKEFSIWKQQMLERYGEFYFFYLDNFVIGPRPAGDTTDIEESAMRQFVSDRYVRTIQDSIESAFPDTQKQDEELLQAFKYFKHYVPEFQTPEVLYFNSIYSAGSSPFGRKQLIIGLDMFLGDGNKDYDSVGVFQYLRHKMKPACVSRYAVESLIDAYFENDINPEQNTLEAMVDRGRKLYFLSYLFPHAPDSLLLGYTQKQTDFCANSEKEIWKFLNDKDVLLKSNSMDKTRYLGEAPTTSGMPADAPGNIGNFVGLQIVRSYMKETGGAVTMHDLLTKYPARVIFEKSKYRP
ncbi:MAG: hypothetical protein KA841_01025 [Chitinophagales bacterium]|jgi:hypothetical protein|nr:hypothetical protein [Chitinophagales bacterium]